MSDGQQPKGCGNGSKEVNRPAGGRGFPKRLLHILFWTALFYGLTVLVARLAEWASGQ